MSSRSVSGGGVRCGKAAAGGSPPSAATPGSGARASTVATEGSVAASASSNSSPAEGEVSYDFMYYLKGVSIYSLLRI